MTASANLAEAGRQTVVLGSPRTVNSLLEETTVSLGGLIAYLKVKIASQREA